MTFKDLEKRFQALILAIQRYEGNLIFVGGCVRDILQGRTPKDFDAEIYGISGETLLKAIKPFGFVKTIGKQFGIFYLTSERIELAIPRKESKIGIGHKGFNITLVPTLSFKEAASRRDLTINSMGYDPKTDTILDPWGGRQDLQEGILRATNPDTFGDDPLRALRVAQFASRLGFRVDPLLKEIASNQDLSELPKERILEEFKKLLVQGTHPSLGFRFLEETKLIRFFPELRISQGLLKTLDLAAQEKWKSLPLLLAILTQPCPLTDVGHFLDRLGTSNKIREQVVDFHQAARILNQPLETRTEGEAFRKTAAFWYKKYSALEELIMFLKFFSPEKDIHAIMERYKVFDRKKIQPIIKGRHLFGWGPAIPPKQFSKILQECHDIQLEEELFDAESIQKRWKERREASCQKNLT